MGVGFRSWAVLTAAKPVSCFLGVPITPMLGLMMEFKNPIDVWHTSYNMTGENPREQNAVS